MRTSSKQEEEVKMTFVPKGNQSPSNTATAKPSAMLPPIPPPYVSEQYYGDPAFTHPPMAERAEEPGPDNHVCLAPNSKRNLYVTDL